jgi:acetyl esterase/lipase
MLQEEEVSCGDGTGWRTFDPGGGNQSGHVFYIHGGGLVFYSVADYASLLRCWASATGLQVTAFSYLRAPEHNLADIADSLARAVAHRLTTLPCTPSIVLAGDSIGAYLALLLALRHHVGRFSRLVLIYPVLDLHGQRPSRARYGSDYPLTAEMMTWFQRLWRRPPTVDFDPFAMPLAELEKLPPVDVFSAEFDVLRDEALEWVEHLTALGRPVFDHHFGNLPHDFCHYAGIVPEARAAVETIGAAFAAAFRPPRTYASSASTSPLR